VIACLICLVLPAMVAAQTAPLRHGKEIARLDALLAAGDTTAAETLLASLAPELAKSDRLAFDTIYVLVGRGRIAEARAQWNRLAPRLQEGLKPAPGTSSTPAAAKAREQRLGEALFTQGLLTARGGDKAEAIRFLQQADGLGFPPLDSPLMLLAADALRDLQEYDLAAGAYREFLKLSPSNVAARLGLGTSLYASGRMTAAQKELEEALRLAPKTPRANYTLGSALFDLKQYDEARVRLERELEIDPRCAPCLSRLAHVAYLDGNDQQAGLLLARAKALDPEDLEARMVSGLLAFRTGHYDVAIDHLSRVVAVAPAYSAAHYQLVMAYQRTGNGTEAREHLEIYQKLLKDQKARELGFRGDK
jgi:tetratricopeptide (TPR) repeat protein